MKHTDEDTLAMMALGEESDSLASLHLHECDGCRREYDLLRRTVAAMRLPAVAEDEIIPPPDDVWRSIASELRISESVGSPVGAAPGAGAAPAGGSEPPVSSSPSEPSGSSRPSAPSAASAASGSSAPSASSAPSEPEPAAEPAAPVAAVRPTAVRRMSRFAVTLAACTALLGAASGSVLTWWLVRPDAAVTKVADGRPLEPLRPNSAGYAALKDTSSQRSLQISVKGLPKTAGYFEVWLMDRSHTKLVSMGVLGPDGRATLPVPSTIDLDEYSVVDVSVQPYNGKPDHSGKSIVRGAYAS
ncbi:anti-sigma factor [Streptomyces sp. NPDC060194]|uniref:anti-sigma factor n=1 Tax=Streptomyces sp. NPDC060194 TaxID=3347069 RepID=UPI003660A62F